MSIVKIAPSILTMDYLQIEKEIKSVENQELACWHLDIMDGNFVPNLTFGPPVIKSLRKALGDEVTFDAHLMINNAEDCFQDYIDAGCNHISVHAEATTHLHRSVSYTHLTLPTKA